MSGDRYVGRLYLLIAICSVLIAASGCKEPAAVTKNEKPGNVQVEPRIQGDGPPTVLFDMHPSTDIATAGTQFYDCNYQAGGKTAKFKLEFKQTRRVAGEMPLTWGEGKFLAVTGSDNTILLQDLKKALDAKHVPQKSRRVAELAFDAVILGEKQSRDSSGGYSSNPAGDWITIKLFFPKGGDEAEVFLNLNPVLGKGEFSIKDSDYGDYLLREFAKVL